MISSATNKTYIQYPVDVISGNVIAGKHIKKACERFFSLMDDDRYMFLEEKVDKVIRLYHHLRHFKGRHSGKPSYWSLGKNGLSQVSTGFTIRVTEVGSPRLFI